jgi:hypothetical protein
MADITIKTNRHEDSRMLQELKGPSWKASFPHLVERLRWAVRDAHVAWRPAQPTATAVD